MRFNNGGIANSNSLKTAGRQLELGRERFQSILPYNDVQLSITCTSNENCAELRKLSQIIVGVGYCGCYPSSEGSIKARPEATRCVTATKY